MPAGCCLVSFLYWPFAFVRWCIYQGWKGFIILGVVAIILLIVIVQAYGAVCDRGGPSGNEVVIPGKVEAPYLVTTETRYYYAREVIEDESMGDVTMITYWEKSGKEWVRTEKTMVLDAHTYGEIGVKKR